MESEQTITERNKIKKYFFDKYGEIKKSSGWYFGEFEDKAITLVDGLEDEITIKCFYRNINEK